MQTWKRIAIGAALTCLVPHAWALERAAPELVAVIPSDQAEIEPPIGEITLIFAESVDLVAVSVITPDQERISLHDAMHDGTERKGNRFTLTLPRGLTMAGTYLIDISASVTDMSDGSASALGTYSSFTIKQGASTPSQ